MKKIKVIVMDKTKLELLEDAQKGDIIDLEELVSVDTDYINEVISEEKDKVYAQKLEESKKVFIAENKSKIDELNHQISDLIKQNENDKSSLKSTLELEHQKEVNELNSKLALLESTKERKEEALKKEFELEKVKLNQNSLSQYKDMENKYKELQNEIELKLANKEKDIKLAYNDQIASLNNEIAKLKEDKNHTIELMETNAKLNLELKINEVKESNAEQIRLKDELINNLQRQKSSLNVKQTGEDLEAWCDNEVTSYMQNGLLNCTWTKDNLIVKNLDDKMGSKADYIFKVYASENHLENEELTSVCMDMKDENPDSVNKQTNEHYYKKLDDNRKKKNCRYALLVSNLEMDKPNLIPIYRVLEYPDMYVVRPAYLMVFLNMIASLTARFSKLILSKEEEILVMKEKTDLLDEFNAIKETYLDKPLEQLGKQIDAIITQSGKIKDAAKAIDESCEKISNNYIKGIEEKLNKFSVNLEKKIVKKI